MQIWASLAVDRGPKTSFLLSLSTLPALAADWPAFRGPGHLGLAAGKLPTEWNCDPAQGPDKNIAWKTPLPGTGHASPILLGDKIYLLAAESAGSISRRPVITS